MHIYSLMWLYNFKSFEKFTISIQNARFYVIYELCIHLHNNAGRYQTDILFHCQCLYYVAILTLNYTKIVCHIYETYWSALVYSGIYLLVCWVYQCPKLYICSDHINTHNEFVMNWISPISHLYSLGWVNAFNVCLVC